ncbi:MAG: DUF4163 domain-containing protein [Lachnospiraceae bacterium]|nr:DUF4163 domain-containing protein [Lachnospiraceae bacterium]
MKKKVLLAMAIIATACLTGCNINVKLTPDEPASENVSEMNSENGQIIEDGSGATQNSGNETTQNSGSGSEAFDETSQAIKIDIEAGEYYSMDSPCLWTVSYEYPVLDDARYPELSMAIQDYRMNYVRNIEAARDDLAALAENDYSEYGAEQWMGYYSIVESMEVKRADATAVSILEKGYLYQGGAHGSDGYGCFNVETKTGNKIALNDVVTDVNALPDIIANELLEVYPDITYWTPTLAETFEAYIEPEITLNWTLDYNGVTFYFGSYEVGSYADGRQQVTVLYSEYPSIFNSYYFDGVTDDYVIPASAWGSLDVDVDADGDADHITTVENYTDPASGFSSFTIYINGQEYTQEALGWVLDSYYVRANGKSYLYVTASAEGDYSETFVYEIMGSGIEYKGMFNGAMKYFTNSSDFCVAQRIDMLGTLYGVADCYVGTDGMPVKKYGVYDVSYMGYVMTSTKAITAELVDENGNLTGETYTFPAGSTFAHLRSDGLIYVDMLVGDGQQCRFYTSNGLWPPTVNGMDATECFETIYGA